MRVMCWFIHHNEYNNFRIEELESLAELEGISTTVLWRGCERPGSDSEEPFVYINVPSEDVCRRFLQRAVLIRCFVHVWADEANYEALRRCILLTKMDEFRAHINDERTWSFNVAAFGKRLSASEQRKKMDFFSSLFTGREKVDLADPQTTLIIAERWMHIDARRTLQTVDRPPTEPSRIVFGREIARKSKTKPWWWKYRLPARVVLGPTSLDTELAFLFCNQGQVAPGKVVLDPFVGTGGTLIAATHLGAFCIGSDIDIRVLKGYGVAYVNPQCRKRFGSGGADESTHVYRNFDEYGLLRPDFLRADNAAWVWRLPHLYPSYSPRLSAYGIDEVDQTRPGYLSRSHYAGEPWVDCIITDPPYGIRAGARQSGHTKSCKRNEDNRKHDEYAPSILQETTRSANTAAQRTMFCALFMTR